jgi:hypothetical protein
MVQLRRSTRYFELFGGLNPGTTRLRPRRELGHRKFKRRGDLGRCSIFRPATAVFRIILETAVKADENGADG